MKFDAECDFIGDLNVTFNGGLESILNFGAAVASSQATSWATSMVSHRHFETLTSYVNIALTLT